MAAGRAQEAGEASQKADRPPPASGGPAGHAACGEGGRDADRTARFPDWKEREMNVNFHIPEWLAEGLGPIGLGIFGFTASRFLDSRTKAVEQARELSNNVVSLTTAVQNASQEIDGVKVEIHSQVGDLKKEIHEQIGGLRDELKEARMEYRERLALMDNRINTISIQSLENHNNIKDWKRDRNVDLD